MKILVACEESQAVTIAFRKLGHEAYSCDIIECSGGYPEWHLQQDVTELLKQNWDMIITFPPCTYLTVSGNKWLKDQPKRKSGALVGKERREARLEGINFFMMFANADCEKIVIENPVGIMSTEFRKPEQIIQPYNFGTNVSKKTCLWIKGLPNLTNTEYVKPRITLDGKERWSNQSDKDGSDITPPGPDRAKLRSKTHLGIAKAMAEQWGCK
jgi:site-specific DNA-cytosine methylase